MLPATVLFILHWLLQIFGQISDYKIHFQHISKWAIVAKKTNNGPTTKEKNQVRVQTVKEKNRLGAVHRTLVTLFATVPKRDSLVSVD